MCYTKENIGSPHHLTNLHHGVCNGLPLQIITMGVGPAGHCNSDRFIQIVFEFVLNYTNYVWPCADLQKLIRIVMPCGADFYCNKGGVIKFRLLVFVIHSWLLVPGYSFLLFVSSYLFLLLIVGYCCNANLCSLLFAHSETATMSKYSCFNSW